MKKDIQKFVVVGNTVEIPVVVDNETIMLKSSVEGVGDNNRLIIGAPLFKLNYYNVIGNVLYCQPFKDSIRRYEYRIKFLNVSQVSRTKLLNYVFSEQRKLMRKK